MFKSKSENLNKVHLNNDTSSGGKVIILDPTYKEEEEQYSGLRNLIDNDNDGSIPQSPLLSLNRVQTPDLRFKNKRPPEIALDISGLSMPHDYSSMSLNKYDDNENNMLKPEGRTGLQVILSGRGYDDDFLPQ